ncbi:hypothetical protein ACFXG4_17960 [Nocardia sp. NPDC059246]|uniref:hypothetical protein n=1 Tax=unclassified Nocardia TaxID=2637762 RepID=UPI0036B6E0DB
MPAQPAPERRAFLSRRTVRRWTVDDQEWPRQLLWHLDAVLPTGGMPFAEIYDPTIGTVAARIDATVADARHTRRLGR